MPYRYFYSIRIQFNSKKNQKISIIFYAIQLFKIVILDFDGGVLEWSGIVYYMLYWEIITEIGAFIQKRNGIK